MSNTANIRALNDEFRKSLGCRGGPGKLLLTPGIARREDSFQILLAVQRFADFKSDNDPWEEHDFGSFKVGIHTIFWKIDYYDKDLTAGSPDPSDPDVTARVLTILLASEY